MFLSSTIDHGRMGWEHNSCVLSREVDAKLIGLVMTLMCLCKTYKSLIMSIYIFPPLLSPDVSICSARVFLGLTESGLFPGVSIAQTKFCIRYL